MPAGRGLMQINRINEYPTNTTFISTYPPSPANCGDIITFNVKVANIQDEDIVPTGSVSVIDVISNTIIGSANLDPVSGTAVVVSYNSSGNLGLIAKYDGYTVKDGYNTVRQFGPSNSSTLSYTINLLMTDTSISNPIPDTLYCPAQDFPISSYTHLKDTLLINPTDGYVQFILWLDASNYIILPYARVNSSGIANSYIPANTTYGVLSPSDGYYLQAIFMGSETGCFAGSSSSGGLAGTKIIPFEGDDVNVSLSITSVPGGICYKDSTDAMVTITGTDLDSPTFGVVSVFEFSTGTIVGIGEVVNGVASVSLDGYLFPTIGAFPHTYTLRARYFGGDPCYNDGYSPLEPPKQLTVNKYTATIGTPTTGLPDLCASATFSFSCQVFPDTNPLDGYFRFDLYRADVPNNFVTSFGVQSVSTPYSFTGLGDIPPNTMQSSHSYYVVAVYTPNDVNCYDITPIISDHSVTLNPTNC